MHAIASLLRLDVTTKVHAPRVNALNFWVDSYGFETYPLRSVRSLIRTIVEQRNDGHARGVLPIEELGVSPLFLNDEWKATRSMGEDEQWLRQNVVDFKLLD